jgi:urease accessory protein UreF
MMLRSKASTLFSLAVLCGGFVFSQPVSSHGQAANFSSLYSNLKTDCKAAVRLKKGEEMEGQDMPLKCRGYGGYEIRIDYSAASSNLRVQPLGDNAGQAIQLGMQPMDYDQTRKVEWRLANGKALRDHLPQGQE